VSQVLRTGQSEVVFSQTDARIRIREKCFPLKEHEGLYYEIKIYPLFIEEQQFDIPHINITMEDGPKLWEHDEVKQGYSGMKAPTKLGLWRCQKLWTMCKIGIQGVQELKPKS
jgi:hypothetical protein